ncbi:hypothetical protein ABZ769_19350 [Streptomyces olivoreticuli]
MSWDDLTLIILAAFGCFTLLLTQISEVLSKLPQIIHAWQQVRHVLRNGSDHQLLGTAPGCDARGDGPTPEATASSDTPERHQSHGGSSARSSDG